jgi:hypothetical protein
MLQREKKMEIARQANPFSSKLTQGLMHNHSMSKFHKQDSLLSGYTLKEVLEHMN